jgi:hypothetical protein
MISLIHIQQVKLHHRDSFSGYAVMALKGEISEIGSVREQPYHELGTTRALSDMSENMVHAG